MLIHLNIVNEVYMKTRILFYIVLFSSIFIFGNVFITCKSKDADKNKVYEVKKFEKDLKNNKKLVMIDFWAAWCKPCKILSPIIEAVARENKDKVELIKVNADFNRKLLNRFRIRAYPTVVFVKDGEVKEFVVGVKNKKHYLSLIKKHVNS